MRKVVLGQPIGQTVEQRLEWLQQAMAELERASHDIGEDEDGGSGSGATPGGAAAALNAGIRASLSDATALTTTDILGASAVWMHPAEHNNIAPYDADEDDFVVRTFDPTPVGLTTGNHGSGLNFPIFAAWDADNEEMFFGTGPQWSGDRTVGTGSGTSETETFRGRLVNKNAITLRNDTTTKTFDARAALLICGFRTTGAAQTEDSFAKRLLSNVYYAQERGLRRTETTDSWSGNANNDWRQYNNSTANAVEVFQITGSSLVFVEGFGFVSTNTQGSAGLALGLNALTPVANSFKEVEVILTSGGKPLHAMYCDYPGQGHNVFNLLELSGGSGVRTWYGDNGDATRIQTGLFGRVFG